MKRITIEPRADWRQKVEKLGLIFEIDGEEPYWLDGVYYQFSRMQIEEIDAATKALWDLCLEACQHIIDQDRFTELGIPETCVPLIKSTWDVEPPSIYSRLDLAYDGTNPPKMLEFNADTPTSLLEAAVVQWHWMKERFPIADQFNWIWDALVAKWSELREGRYLAGKTIHFAPVETIEDLMTVATLRDTAAAAGIPTVGLHIKEIGWNSRTRRFVDLKNAPIDTLFKLYPWEWMVQEEFGPHLLDPSTKIQMIEPIWKMLLSNKGLLAILWELHPESPYLLPAYLDGPRDLQFYAKKPLLSREGQNVTLVTPSGTFSKAGTYGAEGFVYQALAPIPVLDGVHPIIGSWYVPDQGACGIGVRESRELIIDNESQFAPHLVG